MRDGPHSTGQSGHWLKFAQLVSKRDHNDLDRDVKLFFAVGNVAMDAFIACWVQQQNPIIDSVGAIPIVIVADGQSVRAFSRSIDGKPVDFFARPDAASITLADAATGSEWDFTGRAIRGPLSGRQLERIEVLRDFWFDWRTYHPGTAIFSAGLRATEGGVPARDLSRSTRNGSVRTDFRLGQARQAPPAHRAEAVGYAVRKKING